MDYTKIFRTYRTKENIPFYLLNKRVEFPSDKSLYIYDSTLIDTNTPWTILSYKIYNTIDYWWVLCSINPSSIFYAEAGTYVYYIKPEYINLILSYLCNIFLNTIWHFLCTIYIYINININSKLVSYTCNFFKQFC